MHILEIESFMKSLCQSQNSFRNKLSADADYIELNELPTRENAITPHHILRGANLRAKLEMRYSSPKIMAASSRFADALLQLERELNLLDAPDNHREPALAEQTELPSISPSICQIAAENAVALAHGDVKTSNVEIYQSEVQMIATDAPSVEDILRVNGHKVKSRDTDNQNAFPELHVPFPDLTVSRADQSGEYQDDQKDVKIEFFPVSTPAHGFGRAIFATVLTLVAIAGIGAAFPETAKAIETIVSINSIY